MRTFRIVYMGTPEFAVPPLQALLDGPDSVVAVVTQPDRPAGRGRRMTASPVKQLALEQGVEVLQPERVRGKRGAEFQARFESLAPDLVVVAAYGKILPVAVLEVPPLGCINVHASLLPRWRGAGPIQHAIAAGDAETGISIMQMDEGMDTGPVFLKRATSIDAEETCESLHHKLAALGGESLMEVLSQLRDGSAHAEPQDDSAATYAPMLKKEDGRLDFSLTAVELERRVRAFYPWPGTFTRHQGRLLKICCAEVVDAVHREPPGTLVAISPAGIDVACGEGVLRVTELQPEGRRRMSAEAMLAGRPVTVGERLGE